MEDHVQQNRRNHSDGSCRTPPPTDSGGGGTFTAVVEVHMSAPGRHAGQQAENVFRPEDRLGRYTYGGGSVPGTVNGFGSGRTSGQ